MSTTSDIPDGLQTLKPFIQRANEETHEIELLHIIEQTNYVLNLMDELEQEKEELKPAPEEGRAIMELFALKMFGKAEQALENGRCDKILAKIFYTSSILMEACKQFGDLAEDVQKKQKYARWRAAQITKAVNSGETLDLSGEHQESDEDSMQQSSITPSNPFQQNRAPQQQRDIMDTTNDDEDDFSRLQNQFNQQHASFSNPNPPMTSSIHSTTSTGSNASGNSGALGFGGADQQYNYDFEQHQQPKSLPPVPSANMPSQQTPTHQNQSFTNHSNGNSSGYAPQQNDLTDEDIEEAQKLTKYAISALQFYDVPVAIQNLRDALARLGAR
eukprot:CAMPEP_0117456666 /NCGR_PEP_ID=MMETSP0759-20121206/11994_1 /TAXON_ID=63605 /ORGANISM="Percolomonas cosmopolitus, Strain WS" /LENGTH=329 /DNA_ID=CAMNT_0005250011 /DNA_START=82 /DNA_END=1072 /DNA_ORIENTATION=-